MKLYNEKSGLTMFDNLNENEIEIMIGVHKKFIEQLFYKFNGPKEDFNLWLNTPVEDCQSKRMVSPLDMLITGRVDELTNRFAYQCFSDIAHVKHSILNEENKTIN